MEEARAAAEKMPGLLVGEVDMQNTDLILRYRGVAKAVPGSPAPPTPTTPTSSSSWLTGTGW